LLTQVLLTIAESLALALIFPIVP